MGSTGERVYAGGTFDLLHPGHIRFLEACASHGTLIVSLNTDEFAARYKRAPIQTLEERLAVMGALRCVSELMVNLDGEDSRPAIVAAGASMVAHGSDWTGEALMRQMGFDQKWLDEHGVRMLYVDTVGGTSTSDLIARCKAS